MTAMSITVTAVMAMIQDAKKGWIETCIELERPVPEPVREDYSGKLNIRIPKSLHPYSD